MISVSCTVREWEMRVSKGQGHWASDVTFIVTQTKQVRVSKWSLCIFPFIRITLKTQRLTKKLNSAFWIGPWVVPPPFWQCHAQQLSLERPKSISCLFMTWLQTLWPAIYCRHFDIKTEKQTNKQNKVLNSCLPGSQPQRCHPWRRFGRNTLFGPQAAKM